MKTIEIQEVHDAACDACHHRRHRVVILTIGGTEDDPGVLDSFMLCHRCRKSLAAMLIDRATWFRPTPLKRGEVGLA